VTTPGVGIRRATQADAEMMRRLWDEFSAEAAYAPYPPAPFEETLVTDHIALLAEEDGRPVGTVYANLSGPSFGYVFGLYTRPGARGRGIGRALMRAIAGVLRAEGRRYVVLNVDTPNEAARAFYEQLGFADAARTLRVEVDRLLAD
jgi:[ribosomal protein S18]-alanine N-acetyltransferase